MKRLALLFALVMVACEQPEARSPSRSDTTQKRSGRDRRSSAAADADAVMQARLNEREEAQQRQRQRQDDETEQAIVETKIAARRATKARDQRLAREGAAAAKLCEDTRAKRAASAQSSVQQYVDFAKRATSRSKELRTACKLTHRNTGAVIVQSTGNGYRASPEQQDDVSCPRGVPGGFTKQEVWVVLAREAYGEAPYGTGQDEVLLNEHDELDMQCAAADKTAGFNPFVRWDQPEEIKRLLAWTPPDVP